MSNDLEKWLNKKESSKELITDSLIQKFEACLSADVDLSNLLGLHWCLAQPIEFNFNLSEDGHIKKGNFMPPIPLEQRMWASSSIYFYKNLSSLNEIKRVSEIKKIETKHSQKSGELYFLEIQHEYYEKEALLIGKKAYQLIFFGQIKDSLNLAKLAVKMDNKNETIMDYLS